MSRLQLPGSVFQITSAACKLPCRLFAHTDIRQQGPDVTSWIIPANARKKRGEKQKNKTLLLFPGCGCQGDTAEKSTSIFLTFLLSLFHPFFHSHSQFVSSLFLFYFSVCQSHAYKIRIVVQYAHTHSTHTDLL